LDCAAYSAFNDYRMGGGAFVSDITNDLFSRPLTLNIQSAATHAIVVECGTGGAVQIGGAK